MVYIHLNGDMQWLTHRKQQKSLKKWYYSAAHWYLGDVMMDNITFLWFLLFSMCGSLNVAVKMYINYSFLHLFTWRHLSLTVKNKLTFLQIVKWLLKVRISQYWLPWVDSPCDVCMKVEQLKSTWIDALACVDPSDHGDLYSRCYYTDLHASDHHDM